MQANSGHVTAGSPITGRHSLRLAWLAGLAVLLSACVSVQPTAPDKSELPEYRAASALRADDPAAAAERLEALAGETFGATAAELRIEAALAWLDAGRVDEARRVRGGLRDDLEGPVRHRLVLLDAELDLRDQQPHLALQRLDALPADTSLQTAVTRLRARALYQLGDIVTATEMLDDSLRQQASRDAQATDALLIWRGLTQSSTSLDASELPAGKSSLRSWFDLAKLGRTAWQDPYAFPDRLLQWQSRNAGHPAARLIIDDILAAHARRFDYPQKIALLLPLEGRFRSSAEAVRDGFLAAYYQHVEFNEIGPSIPEVLVRNTGASAEKAVAAARSAVLEGAEFIVGPLTKETLAAIDQARLGVPVLGLNYLDVEAQLDAGDNITQFGLLPEDEAIQVAERAAAEGHSRAVALVPDNDFGLRLLAAFRQRFEDLDGELLTVQRFRSDQTDFSTPIMRALEIDGSRLREQTLRSVLGVPLEYEPRRRQDVEFIFLGASTDEARQIRPQLRFHQAIRLPVYSTSRVYNPGLQRERDLDGIRFADMPWVLDPANHGKQTQDKLRALWPARYDRTIRLYALGFDAFRLVPLVDNKDPALRQPLPAMTGMLSIDNFGRIRRDLYWAEFRNGLPKLLPNIERTTKDGSEDTGRGNEEDLEAQAR
ncbi:MAG: penicillin-binding protein activator [Gammaproteobacteria bacterium]|nr:penicillin-binding protein activator [Gammaproteobacteria bacterium]